jgi:hypothetical protein
MTIVEDVSNGSLLFMSSTGKEILPTTPEETLTVPHENPGGIVQMDSSPIK